jgi:hypothetical protein
MGLVVKQIYFYVASCIILWLIYAPLTEYIINSNIKYSIKNVSSISGSSVGAILVSIAIFSRKIDDFKLLSQLLFISIFTYGIPYTFLLSLDLISAAYVLPFALTVFVFWRMSPAETRSGLKESQDSGSPSYERPSTRPSQAAIPPSKSASSSTNQHSRTILAQRHGAKPKARSNSETHPVDEPDDAEPESAIPDDGDIVSAVLRYRPQIRDYIDSLDIAVVQTRARETVGKDPKVELDQLKKQVSEFVDTELKPFASETLNTKYIELMAVSVENSDKFVEIVNLLGEDIDVDILEKDILSDG